MNSRHKAIIVVSITITAASVFLAFRHFDTAFLHFEKPTSSSPHPLSAHGTHRPSDVALSPPPVIPLSDAERATALITTSSEEHRLAQDLIMGWKREGRILSAADQETLLNFLRSGQPDGTTSGEWEERVNEILNLLRSQPGGVPKLAETMVQMAKNDVNPVLRMYALQHIAMWIPHEPSPASREAMVDFLRQIAASADHPLAGSAVLFLSDIGSTSVLPIDVPGDKGIGATALRIATDARARPEVRISALHTCVDQGKAADPALRASMLKNRAEIVATAHAIASDTSLMIPLRKAAIHTIGQFGTQEDRKALADLQQQDPILTAATKPAMKSLQEGKGRHD